MATHIGKQRSAESVLLNMPVIIEQQIQKRCVQPVGLPTSTEG